jgi:predicted AAA+ superfamily ATPase
MLRLDHTVENFQEAMKTLFPSFESIASILEANLIRFNPWWQGKPQPPLPRVHRWAFQQALSSVVFGPAAITVLRGPRQIGKSTLTRQIIDHLLNELGVLPTRILFVQFDELPSFMKVQEPILRITDWFEKTYVGKTFNEVARSGENTYLFFDEIQNLGDWAPQLKSLVDTSAVRVMVTGSSALRIEAGRDSLAGRIGTIEMGPLLLREISELRGDETIGVFDAAASPASMKEKEFWKNLRSFGTTKHKARDTAFKHFSERGAYPIAHTSPHLTWNDLARQLNETVVKRVIEHDLRMSSGKGAKRDPALLEFVFRLACRYDGQAPGTAIYLDEVKHAMHTDVGTQRVMQYLKFLDGTLLIRLIEPLEMRLKKRRGPSKIVLCDHALRASWLQEFVPFDAGSLEKNDHLRDLAGRITEGIVGNFFRSSLEFSVAHFPERGAEPDRRTTYSSRGKIS